MRRAGAMASAPWLSRPNHPQRADQLDADQSISAANCRSVCLVGWEESVSYNDLGRLPAESHQRPAKLSGHSWLRCLCVRRLDGGNGVPSRARRSTSGEISIFPKRLETPAMSGFWSCPKFRSWRIPAASTSDGEAAEADAPKEGVIRVPEAV